MSPSTETASPPASEGADHGGPETDLQLDGVQLEPDDSEGFYNGEDGVYAHIPEADYHDLRRASSTVLSSLHEKSPAHAKAKLEDDSEPTRAQRFGTALHSAVLTPDVFDLQYDTKGQCAGIKGSGDRCTYDGKHPWIVEDSEATAEQSGTEVIQWFCGTHAPESGDEVAAGTAVEQAEIEVLSTGQMEKIHTIRERIFEHEAGSQILSLPGREELTILWTHTATGVECKSRVDRLLRHPELGYVAVDLKTTRCARPGTTPGDFGYDAAKYGYDRQAAFYLEALAEAGIPTDYFLILAVEKQPPYAVVPYLVGHESLEPGRAEMLSALRTFRQCREEGQWPGYTDAIVTLDLPHWRYE
jgi:exodeoxyribonuclease VIII